MLRSTAILLVVYAHLSNFLATYFPLLEAFELPDGVNVFFVLSGFLIGQIILEQLKAQDQFLARDVFCFLKRRWWRTLPNYYLFLVVNLVLIYWQQIPGEFHKYNFLYAFFCQNVVWPFDFMFWESWSLSVEEWFYFTFPILIFVFLMLVRWSKERVYIIVCLLFILVPLIIRSLVNLPNGYYEQWDLWYRKLVVTHADAIGYGMLMAHVLQKEKTFWFNKKTPLFLLGVLCLLFLSNLSYDANILVYKTIYLSLIAICVAISLPFLSTLQSVKFGTELFTNTSKWSYALYLVHLPLLYVMHGNFRVEDACDVLIFSAIYLAIAFALSACIYRYFEKPLMDLRDR